MKLKITALALLGLGIALSAVSQTNDAPKKEKEESITIRKKKGTDEKLTIVIDGDKITVNGKPLDEMKDADIQVLRDKGIGPIMPKIKAQIAQMGGMKMLRDLQMSHSNRALLGVVSEKDEKGARITSVNKDSPAEKAGLQKDDIIIRIGEKHSIQNSQDLYNAIGEYKPGDQVLITYLRNDKEASVKATLGKNTDPGIQSFQWNGDDFSRDFHFNMPELKGLQNLDIQYSSKPRLGIEIQDMEEGKGAKIIGVDNDTPAARAGFQKEDIITEINGKPVESVDDLKAKLRNWKEGETIKISFQRNGKTQTADIKFPKKIKTADL